MTGEDAAVIFERLVGEVDPQETFDRIRIEEKVRLAIGTLDPRYREVMLLRYLEEKEYEEISDILEVPPGTVATLIRRGTQRLRSALEALGLGRDMRGSGMSDLERTVLGGDRQARKLAPRPYGYFLARRSVFWTLAGLSVLLGAHLGRRRDLWGLGPL